MESDPGDPGSTENDDSAQSYDQASWQDDSSTESDGSAPQPTDADLAVPPLYRAPEGYGPGLLGDVKPFATTAIDGRPVGDLSRSNSSSSGQPNTAPQPTPNNYYDDRLAHPGDGGILLVGNPANPRLRREWSQKEGRDWPTDPVTGRNYDVAHIVAKADGGQDHVDNIRPMHPDDHMAEHMANGDYPRWAQRPGIARAFGGTVAKSIEPLAVLSGLLGLVSGRTRTDSFNNFMSDMAGVPSREDQDKAREIQQKALNPNWKPGDPLGV